jgi:hypothetical protein
MFRLYDHHQAADSGVLSQAVCLAAVAVSWINNHELWLQWQSRIDDCMTETCCGNNIGKGEEELLR